MTRYCFVCLKHSFSKLFVSKPFIVPLKCHYGLFCKSQTHAKSKALRISFLKEISFQPYLLRYVSSLSLFFIIFSFWLQKGVTQKHIFFIVFFLSWKCRKHLNLLNMVITTWNIKKPKMKHRKKSKSNFKNATK